ncbi:unnamed protein product [Effrenium voratum]|uniref:Uncharacterized protein n=1 Tax=Effrenium voratum TaxID=2562239 RepID=A0AA36MLB4_9DINO|nr:unnamed protein product [Effrenium voratum]
MEKMLKEFQDVRSSLQAKGLEVEVGHVREPEILNCLVGSTFGCCFSCNLFVSDLFHPNQELHGHIAEAVASLLKVERCSDQACKKVGYAGETCFELNNTQSPEKAQSTASTTTS